MQLKNQPEYLRRVYLIACKYIRLIPMEKITDVSVSNSWNPENYSENSESSWKMCYVALGCVLGIYLKIQYIYTIPGLLDIWHEICECVVHKKRSYVLGINLHLRANIDGMQKAHYMGSCCQRVWGDVFVLPPLFGKVQKG